MKSKPSLELATIATIATVDLATAHGGMKWQNLCASYNVEDRRPGAGTKAQQRAQTDQWNRERGCPTWAELHPAANLRKTT